MPVILVIQAVFMMVVSFWFTLLEEIALGGFVTFVTESLILVMILSHCGVI